MAAENWHCGGRWQKKGLRWDFDASRDGRVSSGIRDIRDTGADSRHLGVRRMSVRNFLQILGHQAQGSEYGQVLLVLPPQGGRRLLTREIIYT